jgi:cAMP phosphodiesterase
MNLRVLGCHGGETPVHRTSSFLVDGRLGIDAGALTSGLSLEEQRRVAAVLVSHSHMDHIRDLATLADNRCQAGGPTLVVAGTPGTLDSLRTHFFNDSIWPDFSRIMTPRGPTISYRVMQPERPYQIAGYQVRPVLVNHTVESCGFVITKGGRSLGYSGDTGPTERLWKVLSKVAKLRALLMEISFPNAQQALATVSGHHTPQTLDHELRKLNGHKGLPVLLYHIKPTFEREVVREVKRLKGWNLHVVKNGDRFRF